MLRQRKNMWLNGHPRFAATATCRHINMQFAPMLSGYANFLAWKYATCSPAMQLWQYAGYRNMLTTAICIMPATAKCQCKHTRLFGSSATWGSPQQRRNDSWNMSTFAWCLEEVPNGGVMIGISRDALSLRLMAGSAMLWYCAWWQCNALMLCPMVGWWQDTLILHLMAAQCIDVMPNDWLAARCFDIMPDDSATHWCCAQWLAAQSFYFAPDGDAMSGYCAWWWHNAWILRLMMAGCIDVAPVGWLAMGRFDITPDGSAMPGYCTWWWRDAWILSPMASWRDEWVQTIDGATLKKRRARRGIVQAGIVFKQDLDRNFELTIKDRI